MIHFRDQKLAILFGGLYLQVSRLNSQPWTLLLQCVLITTGSTKTKGTQINRAVSADQSSLPLNEQSGTLCGVICVSRHVEQDSRAEPKSSFRWHSKATAWVLESQTLKLSPHYYGYWWLLRTSGYISRLGEYPVGGEGSGRCNELRPFDP